MISSVTFENYRGFTRYTLDGLSRVNLLVGKNNCGKTAILEGIHFMMSGGDPNVLFDSAFHRGETSTREDDEFIDVESVSRTERIATVPTIIHFFHGHHVSPGQSFKIISSEKAYGVSAQVVLQ